MKKAFIMVFVAAQMCSGELAVFNVPYRPQPRILIPHVEAPPILVSTNGTVTANPLRDLRYTDFVLCAVDQTGTKTNPVLFQFSTVDTNQQDSAVVFYQRAGTNWPESMERRAGSSYTVTNWSYTYTTNSYAVYTNWNLVVSETNFPAWIASGGYVYTNIQAPAGLVAPVYSNKIFDTEVIYGRAATNGLWHSDDGMFSASTQFIRAGMTAEQKTNFWWSTVTTNSSYEIVTVNILSIGAASSNEAGAIEVFPVRQRSNRSWMRQQNPDVKWMALLSNGSNFYSTADGDPVWFNCWIEWVDRIPTNGVWQ